MFYAPPRGGGLCPQPAAHDSILDGGTTVGIDLRHSQRARITVTSEAGEWTHEPTPRHAEILYLLAVNRAGRTAAQLATDLFGDDGRAITVRAEMSRLRKHLSGVLLTQPYRFDESTTVELLLPDDHARLLPHSTAPGVRRARHRVSGEPA